MRIPRIYHPQSNPLTNGELINLTDEAVNHIARVLRMKSGDALCIFNGDNQEYMGTIHTIDKKNVSIMINDVNTVNRESPLKIHLAQAISRGDKMDFTIQKAVELGVSTITPLLTLRCGVKLSSQRLAKKQQQWQKIAISACEQCGRNYLPKINFPINLSQWLIQSTNELTITLDPQATATINSFQLPKDGIRVIIGPEGGLADQEITQTIEHGSIPISLGPRILRTETAGLTLISALQFQFGDLA